MKLRATLTCVYEYEANSENYYLFTVEKMCKIDKECFEDDPSFMLSDGKITIKVEPVDVS